MTTLATFLLGIVGTLAGRVLLALGIGFVSYAGISAALNAVRAHVESVWNVSSPVMDLLFLAGMGQAAGILLAAISTRAALYGVQQLARVAQ